MLWFHVTLWVSVFEFERYFSFYVNMQNSRSAKKIQETLDNLFCKAEKILIYVMTNTSEHNRSNISVVVRKYLDIRLNLVKDIFSIWLTWIFWFQNRFQNKWSDSETSNDFILVSLLLTLNRFHTLFWCFHYWFWTSKSWLGGKSMTIKPCQ